MNDIISKKRKQYQLHIWTKYCIIWTFFWFLLHIRLKSGIDIFKIKRIFGNIVNLIINLNKLDNSK